MQEWANRRHPATGTNDPAHRRSWNGRPLGSKNSSRGCGAGVDHGADPPRSAAPPIYVPPCAFSDRSPDTAYELARRGEFPVPVICAGRWNWLGEPRNDSGRWNTPTEDGTDDPGLFDIPGQIRKAINDFFAWVVESALNPVLSPSARRC